MPEKILEDEIRKLSVAIEGLEMESRETTDKDLKISIGAQIIAIRNQINTKEQRLLLLEQQGTFHHIFPLSFPQSPRCNLAQSLSTFPYHAFRFGNDEG